MTRIFVLFNLKPGVDVAQYEAWARDTDMRTVRALPSVAGFDVFRVSGLLGSDARPPFAYVEVIEVPEMDALFGDIVTPTMQRVAAEFQAFADSPVFLVAGSIGEPGP